MTRTICDNTNRNMDIPTDRVIFVDGRTALISWWERRRRPEYFNGDIIYFQIDNGNSSFVYECNTCELRVRSIGDRYYYVYNEIEKFYINNDVFRCKTHAKPNYVSYSEYSKEYRIAKEPKKAKSLIPEIEKVIFNPPATIILWKDNTKTVVKCGENEMYDPEFGMAMAISKKALGNQGNYYNTFKPWVEPYWQKEWEENQKEELSIVAKCIEGLADCIKKTYDTVKESVQKEDLLTLKNGYPPKYDTNPKKEDEYIDIKPKEHIGDNSYDRWIKNTPFAEKIRARREAMSMSQKDVAAKIGVGTSTYGYWDSGYSRPSKEEHRQKLAEVLNFKLEELYEVERDLDGNVISTKVIK